MDIFFAVKEHLYNHPVDDPLQDVDMGFSRCYSGTGRGGECLKTDAISYEQEEMDNGCSSSSNTNPYAHFPHQRKSSLSIHIDTSVTLTVNRAHLAICCMGFRTPATETDCDISCDVNTSSTRQGSANTPRVDRGLEGHYVFVAEVVNLGLKTVVGLEKDPEICLLSVDVGDGTVSFGPFVKNIGSFDTLHFNAGMSAKVYHLIIT